MGRFRSWLYRFMYGRYGNDKLNNVLLWAYIALILLRMVVFIFIDEPPVVTLLYTFISLSLISTVIFRTFSRNIAKRRRENEKFFGFLKLQKNKFRDRKTHVYRKCPKCRAVLRLPRAKGRHSVVCPRCRERFFTKG